MTFKNLIFLPCVTVALGIVGAFYLLNRPQAVEKPATVASPATRGTKEQRVAATTSTTQFAPTAPAIGTVDTPAPSINGVRMQTAAALAEPNPTDRAVKIAAIMQNLSRENFQEIRRAFFDEKNLHGRSHMQEWDLVTRRAGEIIGKDAVQFLLAEDLQAQNHLGATKQALTGWATKDPSGALAWLSRDASDDVRKQVTGAAIRGLMVSEPDLAVAAFEGLSADRRSAYAHDFAAGLVRSVGLEKAETLINGLVSRSSNNGDGGKAGYDLIVRDLARIKRQTAAGNGK